jgi:hypothetical protein
VRIISCSLLSTNFVMIFRTQFKRDMGLKSPGLLGLSIFGTRVMKGRIDALQINIPRMEVPN